jgi:hypothetical protein
MTLVTVLPVAVVAWVAHGLYRYVVALALIIAGGALVRRSFRLALIADSTGVEIRNNWRTYSFPWRDVEGVGPGAVMSLRAVGFVLRGGKVRCAQVTCYDRRVRSTTAERLSLYAPPGVRFIPQK